MHLVCSHDVLIDEAMRMRSSPQHAFRCGSGANSFSGTAMREGCSQLWFSRNEWSKQLFPAPASPMMMILNSRCQSSRPDPLPMRAAPPSFDTFVSQTVSAR